MIIVMKPGATKEQVQHVVDLVREFGLKDHVIDGTDRTVIACIGDKRMVDKGAIENAPMVERIVPILAPYKMASLEVSQTRSAVRHRPGSVSRWAANGSASSPGPARWKAATRLLRTAEAVKEAGCIGLRGGAFKPRTSPYAFQGLG